MSGAACVALLVKAARGGAAAKAAIPLLVTTCKQYEVVDKVQLAYVLGTAQHESSGFAKMRELYDGDPYTYFQDKYGGRAAASPDTCAFPTSSTGSAPATS